MRDKSLVGGINLTNTFHSVTDQEESTQLNFNYNSNLTSILEQEFESKETGDSAKFDEMKHTKSVDPNTMNFSPRSDKKYTSSNMLASD